jgi:hypothetical protein
MKKSLTIAIVGSLLFAIVAHFVGCASVAPGNDLLIVRAEQVEQTAAAAFDFVLQLDNSNREFYREKVPMFHHLAEWLREPQNVGGTNYPRAIALVLNVNAVKATYRANHSNSNLLATAIATLESAARQAAEAHNMFCEPTETQPSK